MKFELHPYQREAVEKIIKAGEDAGLVFVQSVESPITGREGNREFFVWFSLEHPSL